jgi:hypothetical protein
VKPRALALVVVLLVAVSCAHADAEGGGSRRTAYALALLREWDQRRAQAWTDGDPAALAGLYTRGSRTGRHDRRMLAAYVARGLRVTGLRTQVLSARVRSWAPGRVTLQVTDRMWGAHATAPGVRVPLPHDRPSTRTVSLRRVNGSWLVEEVTDAARRPPPAPPSGPGTGNPPPRVPPGAG